MDYQHGHTFHCIFSFSYMMVASSALMVSKPKSEFFLAKLTQTETAVSDRQYDTGDASL